LGYNFSIIGLFLITIPYITNGVNPMLSVWKIVNRQPLFSQKTWQVAAGCFPQG